MNLLDDVLTYIRRIIKSPSNAVITDNLLIDYVNRFWIMDVDARIQLFDLKKKYSFVTTPGVDKYNMPLYNVQTAPAGSGQNIAMFPVYQGFTGPCYINGIQVALQTQKQSFFNLYPNVNQNLQVVAVGDGSANYTFQIPLLGTPTPVNPPINALLRGHVDITGIIATGDNIDPPLAVGSTEMATLMSQIATTSIDSAVTISTFDGTGANMIVQDSGVMLSGNVNYGLLMSPGKAPYGNTVLGGGYNIATNTVNYLTGEINVTFPSVVPPGVNINANVYFFETGLPRAILFYNNTLTLRAPPAQQYLVELDGYLSPAAFLSSTDALPFGYMAEYIARGAARKILSDTGDVDQFMFYEPLFREQEMLVWKRSQRQWTATRTETLYSRGMNQSLGNSNASGGNI